MNTSVAPISWQLWIVQEWTRQCKRVSEILILIPSDLQPDVRLQSHNADTAFSLRKEFHIVCQSVYSHLDYHEQHIRVCFLSIHPVNAHLDFYLLNNIHPNSFQVYEMLFYYMDGLFLLFQI